MSIKEKAILVGVDFAGTTNSEWRIEDSLKELTSLAETAGAVIIFQVIQKRTKPHPAYFIGKGKAEELSKLSEELGADLLIFNEDLSSLHQRNLEDLIKQWAKRYEIYHLQ